MIENFTYQTPTKLYFGKDAIKDLPGVLGRFGKKVLLTYGGGSIKKIGLYDKVKELLKDFCIVELSGIEPNPKYDPSVITGAKLCKEHNIDVILAVGGGSVLDCSKAIAVCAKYDGEGWDILSRKVKPTAALPIVDILTLAATGSEYDAGCVISNTALCDKRGYGNPLLYPAASFLDPTYTFSVSKWQTACGTADAINHTLEQFFSEPHSTFGDGVMIAAIKSLMENVKIALKTPDDYSARSELMYVCSWACNGMFANGMNYSGWPMHAIEHALSAFFDITHGAGLAIITPHWMSEILSEKTVERFITLGTALFGFEKDLPDLEFANKVIDAFADFFFSIGIPKHLSEVGVKAEAIDAMADHIIEKDLSKRQLYVPLDREAVIRILKASM